MASNAAPRPMGLKWFTVKVALTYPVKNAYFHHKSGRYA
jgi:hypothetical protein